MPRVMCTGGTVSEGTKLRGFRKVKTRSRQGPRLYD